MGVESLGKTGDLKLREAWVVALFESNVGVFRHIGFPSCDRPSEGTSCSTSLADMEIQLQVVSDLTRWRLPWGQTPQGHIMGTRVLYRLTPALAVITIASSGVSTLPRAILASKRTRYLRERQAVWMALVSAVLPQSGAPASRMADRRLDVVIGKLERL